MSHIFVVQVIAPPFPPLRRPKTCQRILFQRMLKNPSSSNMALLNQKAFERKLQNMSSAQDSVQTVSLWMIHHKKNANDMASVWLDQLRKGIPLPKMFTLIEPPNFKFSFEGNGISKLTLWESPTSCSLG